MRHQLTSMRSQAKHERNFMAELLDEFLASLEERL